MWGLSVSHWIIVIGVVALIFGARSIPKTMGDLGKTVRELKKLPNALGDDDDYRA